MVIEMLEVLMYDNEQISSDGYRLTTDRNQQILTRSFSYLHGDQASWVWPLTETSITIRHVKDKRLARDSYEVDVEWDVKQIGIEEVPIGYRRACYGIDVYEQGDIQACIEEPDFINEHPEVRAMTNYDYEMLFEELAIVYDLHMAERNDNTRVVQ